MRNFILILTVAGLLFSCKKSQKEPICDGIYINGSNSFYFTLVDASTQQNLVFGADAKINPDYVSVWYYDKQIALVKTEDTKASGFFTMNVTDQMKHSAMVMRFDIKIRNASNVTDTTVISVRPVFDMVRCSGERITGIYLNNETTFLKSPEFVVKVPVK
ncbi:hypothetical protein [Chitinophaga sp. Cy-1792]|uniref:hypothetical protein n=1 Tax=Chitinophaga sp. Cy-1792 TaxID=2608339 RepID=UPI0014246E79|nr:hypothetical protein [Chitinophaga sp. Cy-1792]NIG52740.1 hypothetical protein [Chitinophaga sp. Cy-1792]